ncbi:LOW QUALITY PROTEIN: Prp18 domain-containing protein, partial [Endogone sp. FLAS-F59071]
EHDRICSDEERILPTNFIFRGHTNANDLEPDILARITEITHNMQQRLYLKAQDAYLRLSIGNSPWPIGVTMVGIHERSAREKIFAAQVAHVLNDETTRKWIQSLKRLMSFCQDKYPPDTLAQRIGVYPSAKARHTWISNLDKKNTEIKRPSPSPFSSLLYAASAMTTAKREAALSFLSTISLGPDTPQEAIHSSSHSPKPPESTYDDNDSSITVTPPTPDKLARPPPPRPRRKSAMRHDTATSFLANINLSSSSSTAAAAIPQPSAQSMERRQSDNRPGQTPSKRVTTRGQKAPLAMHSTHSDDSDGENGEFDVSRKRTTLTNDRAFREEIVALQEFDRTCEDGGVDGGSRTNTLWKSKRSQSMWDLKPKMW